MSAIPAPGNTTPVWRLLNENRWPLIAGEMIAKKDRNVTMNVHKFATDNV